MKKIIWIASIFVLAVAVYLVIAGLEKEEEHYEVIPDDELKSLEPVADFNLDGKWELDDAEAFFVEYRMQRDRVRSQEVELLEELIHSSQASADARREAEKAIIELVEVMEKELLVENLLKGQGYTDALFFYRNKVATVMLRGEKITEQELAQISDTVAGITGVQPETVKVLVHE